MEITASVIKFCTAPFVDAANVSPRIVASILQCQLASCDNFAISCFAHSPDVLSFTRLGEFLEGHLAISPSMRQNGVGGNVIAVE